MDTLEILKRLDTYLLRYALLQFRYGINAANPDNAKLCLEEMDRRGWVEQTWPYRWVERLGPPRKDTP